jgi:dethiobiotin synthetase/adenosylmethionine--8-amino-7-oxononanoate aminotransferase
MAELVFLSSQDVVIPTDDAFVTSVSSYIRKCATGTAQKSHMYIETAGGES